ncbi:FAD-dependent oxidoreductase [Dactylosporangium sp. NPDC005572]|uniref:FAD-dependent oxidoreductase n=1 Tax=Dactylosporangium sp. NPDC005572 TaxID=3156889 RepID=UPI0033BDE3EC
MAAHGSLTATLDLRGRCTLVVAEPGREPRRVDVADVVELGRGDGPGLVGLDHPGVSRRHARLQATGGRLVVTDLGSRNGTFVDERRITAPTVLAPGSVLRVAGVRLILASPPAGAGTGTAGTAGTGTGAATPRPARRPILRRVIPAGAAAQAVEAFPNYLKLRRRVPANWWYAAQAAAVLAALALVATLLARPALGLTLLWRLAVPVLPLVWLLAPGVWRNSCPLAATNQLPRLLRVTRALEPPRWLREHGYVVAVALFLAAVGLRRPLFDHSGPASAALLAAALAGALLGGLLLKGKSGWCSSVCPLLPIQRLYGQTPFTVVPNSHCRPCVGCAKHCYDFNPTVAYQADLHDRDPRWTAPRRFFAGCMPGVVLGYFLVPAPLFPLVVLASAGTFFALEALARVRASDLAAVYGAVAISLYYWWCAPALAATLHAPPLAWVLRLGVPAVAVVWLWRTLGVRRRFVRHTAAQPAIATALPLALHGARLADGVEVTFEPHGRRVVAEPGTSLLELAERDGLPIEAGCRMGVCGADPVRVVSGELSPPTEDEAATLRRLDLGPSARLACCARVRGPAVIALAPEPASPPVPPPAPPPALPPSAGPWSRRQRRLVIVGNGIAGVTVAQEVRRADPDRDIQVVGREPHPLYNRMGIARMVYGRSAMTGLFLQAEDWYERRGITCWLNTRAVELSTVDRTVTLGTGSVLHYDDLVIATGARASVPALPGAALPGCFVLRDADDAIRIRAYAQEHHAARAVVVGGGPLAVEGAYALHRLGLAVSIALRGPHLLARHVDPPAAALLTAYLTARGIAVVPHAPPAAVEGTDRVRTVALADGRRMSADLVLLCAGATPDASLARAAGLEVRHGIVVDGSLRAAPGVFAAGDVAELRGTVSGLWPSAVHHGQVVAANLLGGTRTAAEDRTPVLVKDIGLDVLSAGRRDPLPGDRVVTGEEGTTYRRLLYTGDRLVGAILVGLPREAPTVLAALRS